MQKKEVPEARLSESKPDSDGSEDEQEKPMGSLVNVQQSEKLAA